MFFYIYKQSSIKIIKNFTTFTTFVVDNTTLINLRYLFSRLYEKLNMDLKI